MECQIWITWWIIFFIRYSRLFWIYILKNLTHAEKVGHTSEFLFGTYWRTWKTTIKKLLKWANKNQNNFNTYNLHFLKKIKKNTWRYILRMCTKPENDMIYSFWDIEHARLEILPFTQVDQKSWSYATLFLRYSMWQIKFWAIFCPF